MDGPDGDRQPGHLCAQDGAHPYATTLGRGPGAHEYADGVELPPGGDADTGLRTTPPPHLEPVEPELEGQVPQPEPGDLGEHHDLAAHCGNRVVQARRFATPRFLAREADAQVIVAEAQAEESRRAVLAELERLLAALSLAEQELAILQESVGVAEEDYRVLRERYQLGAATILELVTSQIALLQAEIDLINARYDYQIAKAELESLVGREL